VQPFPGQGGHDGGEGGGGRQRAARGLQGREGVRPRPQEAAQDHDARHGGQARGRHHRPPHRAHGRGRRAHRESSRHRSLTLSTALPFPAFLPCVTTTILLRCNSICSQFAPIHFNLLTPLPFNALLLYSASFFPSFFPSFLP
jgi:hypothetical protein